MTHRLIESWLPIATLGEEGIRERRSMAALVPSYPVHGWCARRPRVVARRGALEFSWLAPGMGEAPRIATDRTYSEAPPSSVEFWSAGNPLFPRTSC